MLKIWGRANGSNVVKVMWCVGELGIEHERIDWGGRFGGNDDSAYRRLNPMGTLPTIVEDDGFTLWESGPVVRYLSAKHGLGALCPDSGQGRAEAEKWMDWSSLNLHPFNRVFTFNMFILPPEERDSDAIATAAARAAEMYDVLDRHLADRAYLCGDQFTMADIPAGSLTHRWMELAPERPSHPNVEAWYERLKARPAYREHVMSVTPGH
ncbi:MAG: glutathione S-transferase family protein [Rhodospirillaceae bacterium]|jgi:glutathione S-transferase|nr:glutathione S-transferase family protein [Rhodospirillaceae bacterium]MBT5664666.1 glutathione S-transferase family protein [Rhodospirillaceae bacterium]MBT5810361.1 glutathione S-transferase family protein [Rhodospirillaceae bacterium]